MSILIEIPGRLCEDYIVDKELNRGPRSALNNGRYSHRALMLTVRFVYNIGIHI